MALFFFLEEVYADESNKKNLNQLVGFSKDVGQQRHNCYHECFTENVLSCFLQYLTQSLYSWRRIIVKKWKSQYHSYLIS